jgi:L-fuculose-phosphate aldolase
MTPKLRAQVVEVARHLHTRGWVANHDGNVTARSDSGRFIATPTATSKRLVGERSLIEVDAKGKVVAGTGKVFGEIGLHLVVYERRPDINAVVHAHPPHATAISCANTNPIERPFIAEALVSLGPRIPKLPYAQPGEPARAALAPWCELVDAVLLGSHGAIAWGADPEQALLRLELVEHLARIAITAAPLGGVVPLPDTAIPPLLAARAKANIGRAADRAEQTAADLLRGVPASPTGVGFSPTGFSPTGVSSGPTSSGPTGVVACAPAPHALGVTTIPPGGLSLVDIIREEIAKTR